MYASSIDPMVTFLISTHNRREVLLRTLRELREIDRRCELITQTIVVDNASTDGTAHAIATAFAEVELIRLDQNLGACSKNIGLAEAAGAYIVFLDDDSFPTVGSIRRMVDHFTREPRLGAAVFQIELPDGTRESSAYPSVVIGCGTGFRREALHEVRGLPTDFFMQAEEYDLSLKLLEAHWTIRRFDDLHVRHLKTTSARIPARTTRLDMRNNLMVITRHFPRRWVIPFAVDWTRRYWWIAKSKGKDHQLAALRGLLEGITASLRPGHRKPVGLAAFETFAMIVGIRRRMDQAVRRHHLQSIVLVDLGKNLYPFYIAAQALGLRIAAIADNNLTAKNRRYRGIPIVDDEQAQLMIFDAAIIANISPAHAATRAQTWRITGRPVIDLFTETSVRTAAA